MANHAETKRISVELPSGTVDIDVKSCDQRCPELQNRAFGYTGKEIPHGNHDLILCVEEPKECEVVCGPELSRKTR